MKIWLLMVALFGCSSSSGGDPFDVRCPCARPADCYTAANQACHDGFEVKNTQTPADCTLLTTIIMTIQCR